VSITGCVCLTGKKSEKANGTYCAENFGYFHADFSVLAFMIRIEPK
jgi:hypothetical protein